MAATQIALTAEEAVAMAKHAAYSASCQGEELANAHDEPDQVRRLHAATTPYVELIVELQEQLEVTHLDTLREVAQRVQLEAVKTLESERRDLAKLRAGDMDYCFVGRTALETERLAAEYIDNQLDELRISTAVLDRLHRAELSV